MYARCSSVVVGSNLEVQDKARFSGLAKTELKLQFADSPESVTQRRRKRRRKEEEEEEEEEKEEKESEEEEVRKKTLVQPSRFPRKA